MLPVVVIRASSVSDVVTAVIVTVSLNCGQGGRDCGSQIHCHNIQVREHMIKGTRFKEYPRKCFWSEIQEC